MNIVGQVNDLLGDGWWVPDSASLHPSYATEDRRTNYNETRMIGYALFDERLYCFGQGSNYWMV